MQGKKKYQEKLFTDFRLSDSIPRENFYRRLKEVLDLDFLYPLTKGFYGQSGLVRWLSNPGGGTKKATRRWLLEWSRRD